MIVINIVLPPNSMERLGQILMGEQSNPSKAHSSIVDGTRVGETRCFQSKKGVMHEEDPSSTIHRWMWKL